MNALSFQNVSFGYETGESTIRDLSFDVSHGEILSIVGPNGSGKSTLLRLASRILRPRSGRITLDGNDLTGYRMAEIARRLAVVPQENTIHFPFTVTEVVLMGRTPHARGAMFENERDRQAARAAMERTDVLRLAGNLITNLSGGERQRVLIARALAQQPSLLLLDEPNAHLDIAHQVGVFSLVKKMNEEEGLTVVAVSHDLNLASSYSNRMAIMDEGAFVAIGTPGAVLTEERVKQVFGTEVVIDRHPFHGTPRITLSGGAGDTADPVFRTTGTSGGY